MPHPGSERSEVLRVTVPAEAWSYFEEVRDHVHATSPDSKVEANDTGTRQVLTTWVELMLQEVVPPGLDAEAESL